LTTGAEK